MMVVTDEPPEAPLVPNALDTRGGHLMLAASGSILVPFGSYDHSVRAKEAGFGVGGMADISFGVTRGVALGVYGRYFTQRFRCDTCRSNTFAVGPFAVYHAVQGLRFDPWILFGIAYEKATVSQPGRTANFSGIEWLRVAIGGDYYALSGFAFGPYVELDLGSFIDRPDTDDPPTVHGGFVTGLRFAFDTPGR